MKFKKPPKINGDPTQMSVAGELSKYLDERRQLEPMRRDGDGIIYLTLKERFYGNVKRNLEKGKNSRYIALKANLLYWLSPIPGTTELSAEANWRYYDERGRYKGLGRRLTRLSRKGKKEMYDTQISIARRKLHERIQWSVQPTRKTVRLAEMLLALEKTDRSGVLYDTAMAYGRLYYATPNDIRDIGDLTRAHEYAEEASKVSEGKLEWVETLRRWLKEIEPHN